MHTISIQSSLKEGIIIFPYLPHKYVHIGLDYRVMIWGTAAVVLKDGICLDNKN